MRFNESINTGFNKSLLNSTSINVKVLPYIDPDHEDEEERNVNLSWELGVLDETVMEFNLKFEEPLQIS